MKYNSKLSTYKIKKIIKFFCVDVDATKTALFTDINRNTINRWCNIFRQEIYKYQVNHKRLLYGEIELDESYFGAKDNVVVVRSNSLSLVSLKERVELYQIAPKPHYKLLY